MKNLFKNSSSFSLENESKGSESFYSPNNILTVANTAIKLFLDASLRDTEEASQLGNQIIISFISSLYIIMKHGLKGSLMDKRTVWMLLEKAALCGGKDFKRVLANVTEMNEIGNPSSRVFQFICLALVEKKLAVFFDEILGQKELIKNSYNKDAILICPEIEELIENMKSLSILDLNLDVLTIDFEHEAFHTIDLKFLFRASSILSPYKHDDNGDVQVPLLLEADSLTRLKNQNSYLEERISFFTEANKSLSNELNTRNNNIEELKLALQSINEKNIHLICEVHEINTSNSKLSEKLNKLTEEMKFLKECSKNLKEQLSLFEGLSIQRKASLDDAFSCNETLRNELNSLRAEMEALIDSKQNLEHILEDKSNLIASLIEKMEKNSEEINTKEMLINSLMNHLEKKKANCKRLKNKLNRQKEITNLNQQVSSSEIKTLELETALEELGAKFSETTLEVDSLKEDSQLSKVHSWVNDEDVSNCQGCNEPFTLARRRHHCRKCGGIFCHGCSLNRAFINTAVSKKRVCDDCFNCLLHLYSLFSSFLLRYSIGK